jgi:hypothetical protein
MLCLCVCVCVCVLVRVCVCVCVCAWMISKMGNRYVCVCVDDIQNGLSRLPFSG